MNVDRRKELDLNDYIVLAQLTRNSKDSLKTISRRTGLPPSTVFNRIKKMEQLGVIKGYTVRIDSRTLGYNITAVIHFSVEGPYLEEVENRLATNPNIIFLYDVTGDFDIIAVARFKSIGELDHFLKNTLKNPHIKRTITNMVLRIVKEAQPAVPMEEPSR